MLGRDPAALFKRLLPRIIQGAETSALIEKIAGEAPPSMDSTGYDDLGGFTRYEPKVKVRVGGAPLQGLQQARMRRK